ncbi:MAG: GAF domain-containing sensor histidine kinase [Anaerolineales bacterium]|nr:GAF domain-containing sensor histidine kinase [Anaerolineales bacterium]
MAYALEQVLSLLTTGLGSLAYHLLLAFSIAGAFQMSQGARAGDRRVRRALTGLGLLLALQLLLFASSGLVWQGVIHAEAWLPALDRAAALLSLALIIWLWVFPDPSPSADAATLLLSLLFIAAALFGGLWWSQNGVDQAFNGCLVDILAQVAALLLLLLGSLALLVRKPPAWGNGLWMLVLLFLGHLAHLLLSPYGQDYPGAVRLAQVAAFPFLLTLPGRFTLAQVKAPRADETSAQLVRAPAHSAPSLYAAPGMWNSLTNLAAESDPRRLCRAISAMLARTMGADLCLLLLPPAEDGRMTIQCGFDVGKERHIEPLTIEKRMLPMLSASLQMGRSRRLSAANASPDLSSLARVLNLERVGNLMFVPVLSSGGVPVASVLLLSPYTGREWNAEEQSFLGVLAKLLVHLLQRSQEMIAIQDELTHVRSSARQAQERIAHSLEESQKLRDQLAVLQEQIAQEQAQITSMAALVSEQDTLRETIEQLRAANEQLSTETQQPPDETNQEPSAQGELRLALEEIAFLNSALLEADKQIAAIRMAQIDTPPSRQQFESVASIAQDLRQPLSSMIGYTDFLLSESIGILGANQRKYLERIRVSTERMNRLIDDLIQTIFLESSPAQLDMVQIDLRTIIRNAIQQTDPALRQKDISLDLEMPGEALYIHTDQGVLHKIMIQLLENASIVTPARGGVAVRAHLEHSEGQQDYVLLQIADGGQGISAEDLPRVFSSRLSSEHISGISENGVDLSSVKSLVELLGGRAWVDSEIGQGATFSVLLPVTPPNTGEDDLERAG